MVERRREERSSYSAPASPRATNRLFSALENGRTVSPGLSNAHSSRSSLQSSRNFHPDASLVLVGVRGSGKRSLGLIAATALRRRFITEDHFFQSTTGLSRQDYLKVHGSEEFHKQDVDITRQMLEQNKSSCVIDCGLGSMTSSLQEYLKQYRLTNPVVYLMRDDHQIQSLLNLGERSAKLLHAADPSHRKCSNYEFYNLQEDSFTNGSPDDESVDRASPAYSFKLRRAQEDFSRFVRFITGKDLERSASISAFSIDVPIEYRAYTYALELPLSTFAQNMAFEDLASAGDIVEIVVDSWVAADVKRFGKLIATARRYMTCPVLVSVRIPGISTEAYLAMLHHSLRLGVEYLSIDLNLSHTQLAPVFAARGHTKIIGTLHERSSSAKSWDDPLLVQLAKKAATLRCAMVRIMLPSTTSDELAKLHWFREELRHKYGISIPVIAYATGRAGRTTQLFNPILTPVSYRVRDQSSSSHHQDLQVSQVTAREATKALFVACVLNPLNFCIIGGNVAASLSPCMHNAAYAALGLGHNYTTRNITSWDDIEQLAKDDSLGGCSVVQPWKVKMVSRLASLSHHAKAIGAVNTLMPLHAASSGELMPLPTQAYNRNRAGVVRAWYGENTDFIGIMVCLARSLSPRNVISPKTTGLVIGAGGMARAAVYAMLQMGCRNVFVYNRTVINAQSMARHFNEPTESSNGANPGSPHHPVCVLETLEQPWPAGSNMPTMIVSCVTHEDLDGKPGADFKIPDQWLQSPSGGAVIEMAYMTKETVLIQQIKQFRDRTGLPWVPVDGIETLIEQAIAQFQIMTGRRAPTKAMTAAIRAELRTDRQYVADGEEYMS